MNGRIYNNVMDDDVRTYFSELIGNDEKRGLLADTLSALRLANIGLCRDNVVRLYKRWEGIKKDTPTALQFLGTEAQTARTELCRQAVDGLKKLITRFETRPNFQVEVSFAGTGKPRENQIVDILERPQWRDIRTMTYELHRQLTGMQAVCMIEATPESVDAVTATPAHVEAAHEIPAPDFTDAGLSAIFKELKNVYIKGTEKDWLALCHCKAVDGSTLKWVHRNGNKGQQALAELLLMIGYKTDDLFATMEMYFNFQYKNISSLTSKLKAGEHSAAYGKLLDIVNNHREIR